MDGRVHMSLRVAVVCKSNMNRSMEAHRLLESEGFDVHSYGVADKPAVPGYGHDRGKTKSYHYGTPYADILAELSTGSSGSDYADAGILAMLRRNAVTKRAPQRLVDAPEQVGLDIVITFEKGVFESTLHEMRRRRNTRASPAKAFVVLLETPDQRVDAVVGAQVCLKLCLSLEETSKKGWEQAVDAVRHGLSMRPDHLRGEWAV